jgi:general secretion pathway protein E
MGARPPFLDWIVTTGRAPAAVISGAQALAIESVESPARIILKLGLMPQATLADSLREYADLPGADLQSIPEAPPSIDSVNVAWLRDREIVPIADDGSGLHIVCWDPLDEAIPRMLGFATERNITQSVATRDEVRQLLDRYYPSAQPGELLGSAVNVDALSRGEELERLKDLASDAPIIRLVQQVIGDAIASKSSDIHIEPDAEGVHLRLRMDGLLRNVATYPAGLGGPIVSRIKVLAGLNIAERRLPQDGRIKVTVHGKDVDLRVATAPTLHGESVVLRILDRQDVALDFDALGFDDTLKLIVREALTLPHGIILVTGPTGSGKTTTLYAALREINRPERKILTVEDPVEYTLAGVNQVPVRPQIGLTFAAALRSFLRQDPDVLMVGEIRDRETAEIAIQAALTGHLLLSTLHTNTAAAAITRLLDMGIDDYLLTSTLNLVLGQRLVRRLCMKCRESYEPSDAVRERFGAASTGSDRSNQWCRPVGCAECQGTGYRGRIAILEALRVSESVRKAVLSRADAHTIEQQAVGEGMRTLLAHGVERVNAGVTTMEEVLRVTSLS